MLNKNRAARKFPIVRTIIAGSFVVSRALIMARKRSRRDFLKLSACSVMAAGCANIARAVPQSVAGQISVIVTGGQLRNHAGPSIPWTSGGNVAGAVIE